MAYKKSNANGQATMANSEPVVIASDQTELDVAITSALPVGANTIGNVKLIDGSGTNVSGSSYGSENSITVQTPNVGSTGTISGLNSGVSAPTYGNTNGHIGDVIFQITGTWDATLTFQGTINATDWVTLTAFTPAGAQVTTTTTNGIFTIPASGLAGVRVYSTAYNSGTVNVTTRSTHGSTTANTGNTVTVTDGLNIEGDIAAAATDSGNPVKIGGKYNSTQPTYTDGQRGDVQLDTRGNIKVSIWGPNASQASGWLADNADAVAVASTASRLATTARSYVYNGTSYDRQRGDTNGTYMVGNIGHDSPDASNPVKVGYKAKSTLSGVTLVAADDRTDGYADLDGAPIVKMNGAFGDYVSGTASNTDGTSTQVLAAGAAGVKHYITDVTIANTSASNIYVELKDGTTAKWVFPVPANGGVTHHFSTPIAGTAATAWNFDPSAAATTVYCSVSGFKSKI